MSNVGLAGPKRYVPAWENVHEPAWADIFKKTGIGPHDWPLKEGVSGEIGLTIRAMTPLVVGASQEDVTVSGRDEGKRKNWLVLKDKRAISSTSIKGAVRGVLEPLTHGRFAGRMDERRLSIRDLQNRTDYIDHLTDMFRPLSQAGWLKPSRNGWELTPCQWSLVRQSDLERYHKENIQLGRRQSSSQKYQKWGWQRLSVNFDPLSVSTEGDYAKGRELSRISNLGKGRTKGHIVFTGQPQDRIRNGQPNKTAKSSEFIFHGDDGDPLTVPADIRRDFESINRDDAGTPNEEWGMWLTQYRKYKQRIPVFWLDDGSAGIKAIGLAMMFRLPYAKTLHEAAPTETNETWDMADLIFGRVVEDQSAGENLSLKGRASFSHFLQSCDTPLMAEQETVLLAPKYGFYPALIKQLSVAPGKPPAVNRVKENPRSSPVNQYTTLQDDKARLRGASRYVASRGYEIPKPLPDNKGKFNRKIITRIQPVKQGATFTGKLRVFNLDPRELGALIWTLHWGGAPDDATKPNAGHAHMIGAGKAFGLGACEISIDLSRTELACNDDPDFQTQRDEDAAIILRKAVAAFTAYMESAIPGWSTGLQKTELLTLANLDHGDKMRADGLLEPMRTPREFVDAKKMGYVLPLASGGYEVDPSKPKAAPPPAQSPNKPAPAARPRWRKGDRAINIDEGEEVTVMEDVGPNATTALVQFHDGETECVNLSSLTKV
ncbi:TIGR03986 family type III CRISPR-associated RAMP protein [Puniceibacterium sediminis]|uniref:CRISPR-associated protein n=1 Tax=Puniceibacterium sediminis TaxID=1608407 RepID=A0A238WFR2_9RHOB|nr:TIGR03986 family CRISPR-associated RAMP protein [Puniceibacterium sediminis]SNR44529.1 CRISPR-associated protein [Puniceibacterium sediminis]